MAKKASKKTNRSSTSSNAKSAQRPAGKPSGKPAGKPSGKPTGKPAARPGKSAPKGKPFAKSAAKPTGKPVGKPAAKSKLSAKPTGKSARPAAKPAPRAGKSANKPSGKPLNKSAGNPGKKRQKPQVQRQQVAEPQLEAAFEAPVDIVEPLPPAPSGPITKTSIDEARAFAIEAARLMSDDKCIDIVVLDVTALTSVSDFIVIGTGTSDRQMRSTLGDITEFGRTSGHQVARRSEDDRATWVLADFVDVVCHLFEPNTRAYYDLEMMWGDAPRIDWARAPGDTPKPRNQRIVE